MNEKLKMRFEELKNNCKLSDAAAQEVICAENEIEWQVEILKSVDEAISLSGKQLSSLSDLLAKTSDPEVERTLINAISAENFPQYKIFDLQKNIIARHIELKNRMTEIYKNSVIADAKDKTLQ